MNDTLIDRLIIAYPPPASPEGRGTRDLWPQVEDALGLILPEDYKQFINIYGTTSFANHFGIKGPFTKEDAFSRDGPLFAWMEIGRRYYEERKEMYSMWAPEKFPYVSYPEPGGLLAIGGIEYGGVIYWHTGPRTEDWSIVIYEEQFYDREEHECCLVEFLLRWATGRLDSELIEIGPQGRD